MGKILRVGALVGLLLGAAFYALATVASYERLHGPNYGECRAIAHGICLGLWTYSQVHEGKLPDGLGDVLEMNAPAWDERNLQCPVLRQDEKGRARVKDRPMDYIYVGQGLNVHELEYPEEVILLFDAAGNHPNGTRTVLWANCSCGTLDEEDFRSAVHRALHVVHYPPAGARALAAELEGAVPR